MHTFLSTVDIYSMARIGTSDISMNDVRNEIQQSSYTNLYWDLYYESTVSATASGSAGVGGISYHNDTLTLSSDKLTAEAIYDVFTSGQNANLSFWAGYLHDEDYLVSLSINNTDNPTTTVVCGLYVQSPSYLFYAGALSVLPGSSDYATFSVPGVGGGAYTNGAYRMYVDLSTPGSSITQVNDIQCYDTDGRGPDTTRGVNSSYLSWDLWSSGPITDWVGGGNSFGTYISWNKRTELYIKITN